MNRTKSTITVKFYTLLRNVAIIEPFINHQHLLPSDDITQCMVPHLQIYSSRSGDIHVVPLQSIVSQCISI